MADEIGYNVTSTRNQAKMPEGDIKVTVTLEFTISNESPKRTPTEMRECIAEEIAHLALLPSHKIWNFITDHEVSDG